jgi:hypothetical protein
MPYFRSPVAGQSSEPVRLSDVRKLAAELIHPAHFFVGPGLRLEWLHVESEELAWEVFQGRLLDPAHTRQRQAFEAWDVYQVGPLLGAPDGSGDDRSEAPLLALLLDAAAGKLHVVRGMDSYGWEGYEASGGVILSRQRRKWTRELVGTIHLKDFGDPEVLRDELACQLFLAVIGTSRLPLSSVEAPLPAYAFGQLLYCYRPGVASGPLRTWQEMLAKMLAPPSTWREQARVLETLLRSISEVELPAAAVAFVQRWSALGYSAEELLSLLRTIFNEVSLSPYTALVDRTLAFLRILCERGHLQPDQVSDFAGYLLRQVGRHLTAYDLVTFHHRGANYPDALLLDAVLKEYLAFIERWPELFVESPGDGEVVRGHKRIRRRALRQGWLIRRRYEEHPVPDLPTSPGENLRVLPPTHPRVSEEQILQPAQRTRRLFAGDPLTNHLGPQGSSLLRQSLFDLEHPQELRELGLALFLDRPFGAGKAPAEPDATLLLTSEAYSSSIARQRLHALAQDLHVSTEDSLFQRLLGQPEVRGLSLDAIGGATRPGTVSLADARRAAPDFVFLRTTPGSVKALLAQFDFTPLLEKHCPRVLPSGAAGQMLITRAATGPGLMIYDALFELSVELEIATEQGYESRAGQEYPAGGLRVVRVWEYLSGREAPEVYDLHDEPIRLPPIRT